VILLSFLCISDDEFDVTISYRRTYHPYNQQSPAYLDCKEISISLLMTDLPTGMQRPEMTRLIRHTHRMTVDMEQHMLIRIRRKDDLDLLCALLRQEKELL